MGRMSELMLELQEEMEYEEMREWIYNKYGEIEEGSSVWYKALEEYEADMMLKSFHEATKEYGSYNFNSSDNYYVKNKTRFEIFQESLSSSVALNEISNLDQILENNLKVMIFGHVVSATEGYLSFTFIDNIMESDERLRILVETDPEFSKRRFSIKEIFQKKDSLRKDVKAYLKSLIFHKLAKVKILYKNVLNIDFGNTEFLHKAIEKRHDCVHRAGYNKDGNYLDIDSSEITDLITECKKLVIHIENNLNRVESSS